jgi:antitoxin CcdA
VQKDDDFTLQVYCSRPSSLGRRFAMAPSPHRPVHLTIDVDVLRKARAFGINLSRAGEEGIRRAILREELKRDTDGIAEVVRSSNEYVRKHGLPLRNYR